MTEEDIFQWKGYFRYQGATYSQAFHDQVVHGVDHRIFKTFEKMKGPKSNP